MLDEPFDHLELISLFAAKAIDMRHIPAGYVRVTAQDIAGRIAHCTEGAIALARYKIAGEQDRRRVAYYALRDLAEPIVERMKYPSLAAHLLSSLAIQEMCDTKTCPWCKGTGYLLRFVEEKQANIPEDCQGCHGKSRIMYTDHKRAKAIAVHHEEFKRNWAHNYAQILTILYGWEDEIREALRR